MAMRYKQHPIAIGTVLSLLTTIFLLGQVSPKARRTENIALINGQWFEGESFKSKPMYSSRGLFTSRKPSRIDRTIDLKNRWIVPPFADAHSHSFGLGIPGADAIAAQAYQRAGVFYVQSQGNLPMTEAEKAAILLNSPEGIDVALSNATVTSHNSALHAFLASMILPRGIFPGYSLETLNGVRYFEIDSNEELKRKWPLILAQKNDFIKTYLWLTDNAPFVGPAALTGQHALSEDVFRSVVSQAHAVGLRVSAHIVSAGDFKLSIEGGADEIAHMPSIGIITPEVAKMAARRNVSVVTTMAQVGGDPEKIPIPMREAAAAMLLVTTNNLKVLAANGVSIVIGADNPADTTTVEASYIKSLGIFNNAAMLRMWGTATPRAIFPDRKIGAFKDGYEASFLSLDADPLKDWAATERIQLRFKQGTLMATAPQ
jgi:hypothetical protein